MKKLLLSLFMSVMACLGAVAQTTVTAEQLSAAIGKAETISGYTFDIEKNNGSTAPSLHAGTNAIRLYAKGTLKISGDKLTKIVIKLASDASYRYTTFEPSAGALNPAQAAGDTEIVWEGDATEVTFTVGDNAIMGTDGETKAGQIRLASVTIYGEPGEGGDTPVVPTPDENIILSADFENDACGFTFADNVFGDSKNVWQHDAGFSCMKASAYADGANAVEGAYLVSPVMDLTNRNEIVLTFKHALGHAKTIEPAEMLSLWVREENMDWSVQLPIQAWPSYEGVSGNFTKFAEAGEYDLDQFKDKKIQLGWKYTSTDATAPTWEIDAVKVTGKIENAISDIEADVNAPVEYFNLQGVRVANPENGLYIMRQGNKVTKVIR